MKTFRQFIELQEAQQVKSVFDSVVLGNVFIFTPALMKRLGYTIDNVTAYHMTAVQHVSDVIGKQGNKSTQLSVFTSLLSYSSPESELFSGIETEGGVLLELEGQVDAYFGTDVFTDRLKGGRRSVLISKDSDYGSNLVGYYRSAMGKDMAMEIQDLIYEMSSELRAISVRLQDIYIIPILVKNFPEVKIGRFDDLGEAWDKVKMYVNNQDPVLARKMGGLYDYIKQLPGGPKAMQKIVKEYLDETEKLIKGKPKYKLLFVAPERDPSGMVAGTNYDEALMSNYKVKKAYLWRSDLEKNKTDIVKADYEQLWKIPVEVLVWVSDAEKLARQIEQRSKSIAELIRDKFKL